MIRALPLVLLTAVYALTLASLDLADLLTGALFSALLLAALWRPAAGPAPRRAETARRLASFPAFAWAVLREITAGTWLVANVVVGRRPLSRPGIVAVPIGERSEAGVAATSLAVTLSPGEVLVDVDWDRREMLVHVLEAEDPDAVRRRYDEFYRRYQRSVFP